MTTSCAVCEVSLSGGRDTFGAMDAPLCAEHWFAVNEGEVVIGEEVDLLAELLEAEKELADAQYDLEQAESDIDNANEKIDQIKQTMLTKGIVPKGKGRLFS